MEKRYLPWIMESKSVRWFLLICLLFCAAYYVLEVINGRAQMADFRVYYDAANASIQGNTVYGVAFGVSSGFYKYSPLALFFFMPLAVLPYAVASILFYALITWATLWWLSYLYHWLVQQELIDSQKTVWVLALTTLFMADHIERELHLGNVNLFLLILAFFVFKAMIKRRDVQAGILYATLILVKPHFLILMPYFVWKGKWKLSLSAGIATVSGFVLPALYFGWYQNMLLHKQWFDAIRDHNVVLSESPNTVYGLVTAVVDVGKSSLLVPALLALVAFAFLTMMLRNRRVLGSSEPLFIEYFVLIALIPNLAHTDTEHFMWTWPLILYAIAQLMHYKRALWPYAAMLGGAFVPYCINSPDLVGRSLQQIFDGGLLGLSNLFIILVASGVWFYSLRHKQPSTN